MQDGRNRLLSRSGRAGHPQGRSAAKEARSALTRPAERRLVRGHGMLSGMMTTDNPFEDGNAIIERTHEVQREMVLAFVRAAAGMARETENDPVESAMDLAEQVLREQPPPPGAERRKWLDAVLTRVCGN